MLPSLLDFGPEILRVAKLLEFLRLLVVLHKRHGFGREVGDCVVAQRGVDALHLVLVARHGRADELLDLVRRKGRGRKRVKIAKLRIENVGQKELQV
jgi:hypothetical protein